MAEQYRDSSNNSGLTKKQKQAALVLGACALAIILTISAVALIISLTGKPKGDDSSGSSSTSGSIPDTVPAADFSQYGDTVLAETDDAGKEYIEDTIFVGDSNTERYHRYGLLDLDHVVAVEGLGVETLATEKAIYFKGDEAGYTIPEALAKMKPRRIIVMMGTNDADGNMSASEFASGYKSALESIKSAYQYTDIIVAAVPPIPEDHSEYASMSMDTINEYNQELAKLCSESGYKFLNTSETLMEKGYGKAHYFQAGDVHLKKDGMNSILTYARTHAWVGTEDARPDTNNIPARRSGTGSGSTASTPTPDATAKPNEDEKLYTAQYNVDKNVGGTLTSGDLKDKTSITYKDVKSSDSVTVKAVPASGYVFVKWSDGKTDATRTDKSFTQNINVTAMFSADLKLTITEGSSGTVEKDAALHLHATLSDKSLDTKNLIWTKDGTEFKRGYSCQVDTSKEGTFTIKATITINSKTYVAEYKLTVKPKATTAPTPTPTVESIAIQGGGLTVEYTGKQIHLTVAHKPSEASQPKYTWSCSGGALSATEGNAVTFTAPANSSTEPVEYTITVKGAGKEASAKITVAGKPADPDPVTSPPPTEGEGDE